MAVELGTGYVSLTVSARGIQQNIAKELSGVDTQAAQVGQKAGQSFGSRFQAGVSSLASSAGRIIAGGFAVGAAGAGVLAASLVKVGVGYNTLEQSSLAAFKTILGSSEAAVAMQDSLRKFALTSPFPRQAFIEATQQLLGFGVSAEQIIPTLSAVQDAVAAVGGNANDISQITFALAQVKGQGKLTGETLNQLGQFGIDAASIIGAQMGKTSTEIRDMAMKPGGIPADLVFDPLVAGLTEKFGGAAEGLKGTWLGAVDRIKGAFRDIASDLAEPFVSKAGGGAAVSWANTLADAMRSIQTTIIPVLATALGSLAGKIQPFVDKFAEFIKNISAADVTKFVDKISKAFSSIGPLIAGAATALGTFGAGGLPFIGPLLGSINPLVAGLLAVGLASPDVRDAFKSLIPIATGLAKTLGKSLRPVLPVIAKAIGQVAKFVGDLIAAGIESLAPVFVAIVEAAAPLIPVFVDLVTAIAGPFLRALDDILPSLADLAKVLGGALADSIKIIAPVLPDLARTLGKVAVIVGQQLAGALTDLAPALPAFAELVRIGAELIAKVPPDVLAAIALAFLAFKGTNEIIGTVGAIGDKFKRLGDSIVGIGTKSDGARTLVGKLIDKLGGLAKGLAGKIAIKLGVETTLTDIGGGAAGEAGGAAAGGLISRVKDWAKRQGPILGGFLTAALGSSAVAGTALIAIPSTIYAVAFPEDIPLIATPAETGNLNFHIFGFDTNKIIPAIGGAIQDAWNAAWDGIAKADLGGAVTDWFDGSFDSIGKIDVGSWISGIGDFFGKDLKLGEPTWVTDFVDGVVSWIEDALGGGIRDVIDSVRIWIGDTLGSLNFDWVGEIVGGLFGGSDSKSGKGGGPGGPSLATIDTSFLDDAFRPVIDWVGGLPARIISSLPDLSGVLVAAGTSLAQGLGLGLTVGFQLITAAVTTVVGTIQGIVSGGISGVSSIVTVLMTSLAGFWQAIWNLMAGIVSGVWGFIAGAVSNGLAFVRAVFDGFVGGFNAAWSGFWNGLSGVVSGIAGAVGGAFETVLSTIRAGWNAIARFLNGIHIDIPSVDLGKLGEIGGGSFDLPHVPLLATGGFVKARKGGTLALIGERGQDEVVIPKLKLRDLAQMMGASVDGGGSQGPLVGQLHVHALDPAEGLVKATAELEWISKTTGKV